MFHTKLKSLVALLFLLGVFSGVAHAQTSTKPVSNNPDAATVQPQAVAYKNWTFKDLKTSQPVDLREWSKNKKLVMVVYFAPWCHNWKSEAALVAKLHEKYKDKGFAVIGVSNYAAPQDTVAYFGEKGAPYTVVVESDSREARDKTEHYTCRIKTGDKRRWGSPYHVLLEPAKFAKSGEVLAEKADYVVGDLIEADIEKFIREKLSVKDKLSLK